MLQFSQSLNKFLQDKPTTPKKLFLKKKKKAPKETPPYPVRISINPLGSTINLTA